MATTHTSVETRTSPAAAAERTLIGASAADALLDSGQVCSLRSVGSPLRDSASVRTIARGIYPPVLADLGLREALRAQAARVAIEVRLVGIAPPGTEEAEEAVYFACSEAIQNAVKPAGDAASVVLRLLHHHESLVVRIADDGRGFDPVQAAGGVGLQNIRDRIEDLGGTFELASKPGSGTVVTLDLPWPTRADRGQ